MTLQTFTLGTFAQQGFAAGSYESIATITVGVGGASNVEFTSIPSTYTHLQVRGILQSNRSSYVVDNALYRFNSDTGSNYSIHTLFGGYDTSPSVGAGGAANYSAGYLERAITTAVSNASIFSTFVMDILDYANTNKYKTTRYLLGFDMNGTGGTDNYGGTVSFGSASWRNTSAVTSILLAPHLGTKFNQYSHFALYGIKAA